MLGRFKPVLRNAGPVWIKELADVLK